VSRNSGSRPLGQRDGARLLHGVFGRLEIADEVRHGRDGAPPVGPDDRIQGILVAQLRPPTITTGRTSTEPRWAAEMVAAQRNASSRSAHSSR